MPTPPLLGHESLTFLFPLGNSTLWLSLLLMMMPRQVNHARRGASCASPPAAATFNTDTPRPRTTWLLTLNTKAVALDRQHRNANMPDKRLANMPRLFLRTSLPRNPAAGRCATTMTQRTHEQTGGGRGSNIFFRFRGMGGVFCRCGPARFASCFFGRPAASTARSRRCCSCCAATQDSRCSTEIGGVRPCQLPQIPTATRPCCRLSAQFRPPRCSSLDKTTKGLAPPLRTEPSCPWTSSSRLGAARAAVTGET